MISLRRVDSGQNTDRTDCRSWEEGKSPAKRSIMGDAGGILRGSSGKENTVAFSAVQPHRLEVLKAASNAFVAEEQAPGECGLPRWHRPSKRLLHASSPGDRASSGRPGAKTPGYPCPFATAVLRRDVAYAPERISLCEHVIYACRASCSWILRRRFRRSYGVCMGNREYGLRRTLLLGSW